MKKIFLLFCGAVVAVTACKDKPQAPIAAPPAAPKVDTLCYQYAFKEDRTTLSIVVKNDSVAGEYNYMPHEKDGAYGTVKGVKKGDTLVVDYKYTMEGSDQEEQVYFVLVPGGIAPLQGELDDKNGKLVIKNIKKAVLGDVLKTIDCAKMSPTRTMD